MDHQHPHKTPGVAVHIYNPRARKQRQQHMGRADWLGSPTEWSYSRFMRDWLKSKVTAIERMTVNLDPQFPSTCVHTQAPHS